MKKEPKLYTVEITDTAWDMLIEHAKFLARVDLPTANKLVDAFLEVTESQQRCRNETLG